MIKQFSSEMDERKKKPRIFEVFVGFCVCCIINVNAAVVSNLEPKYGSLGGETRLTIYGSGFSADQFSQNDDPNSGNKVYLVGESGQEFSCPVHKDGTTEIQIMCYTPERMPEESFYVNVVVDGDTVSDANLCGGNPTSSSCRYQPKSGYTPTITSMSSQSGLPESFVTLEGKLFSDRYGSNLDESTNHRSQKLLRVYVGPQDCGLKNGDDFYGLALNNENTDDGTLKCKAKGTSVGFFNASFIIESPFGRSKPNSDVYRVSYNDQIYMYQTYTDITSINPTSGSTAGGLKLTIYGNYFDNRAPYVAPRAYIGDSECVITNVVVDEYIECTVAADPQFTGPNYEGNRGVNFEYWTSTSKNSGTITDILSLTDSDAGYNSTTLDETYHYDSNGMDSYVSRMTTLYTPPHDGDYAFALYADDGAKLYIDGTEVATSNRNWGWSSRMTLQQNTRYLLKVIHFENVGNSYFELKAKFYDTKFTATWTGKAEQEKQTIGISSTVEYDVQRLTFSDFVNQTYVKEVQTLDIETGGEFRIGLFSVYSEPLTLDMDDVMVSDAVNALPIFGSEESLSVVRNPTDPPSFTFTFESKRGDFPDLEVVQVADSSNVTYSVTEDTQGSPDMETLALSIDRIVSKPFSVSSLDAGSLNAAITGMFEAKCPSVFESASLSKHYESFEGGSATFSGSKTKGTEPFCGRYSLKNPSRLYKKKEDDLGISLSQYGTVCFAYKGVLKNYIYAYYTIMKDEETVSKGSTFNYEFKKESDTKSDMWYYTCINLYSLIYDEYPDDTQHRLTDFWIQRANGGVDCYVDSLFIGRSETTTDSEVYLRRLPPAMPNSVIIDEVSVTLSSANVYDVTLKPFDCGNQLPLFELENGYVSSGAIAYPSAAATLKPKSPGIGSIAVSRLSFASPPVTGLVDITLNGITKTNLNVSLGANDFKRELESLEGIGSLEVTKTGDCANFQMATTFVTLPGDIPEMTVVYGNLNGINAAGTITTNVNGGLYYSPLTGDMVATVHDKPQVRVYMNDVPTACTGDCGFEWDTASTPTVTAVTPTSGASALSTSITITGTGFNATEAGNTVLIGGVACTVTAATSVAITCDVGNGPVGDYKVMVNVGSKGDADHSSGDVLFTYTADIDGVSPSAGSLGGGTILNITGYGFKSGADVTINSETCDTITVQPDLITCSVPTSSVNGTYDVVVQQGGLTLTYDGYTYNSAITPTVSDVSPSTITVLGDTVTIMGTQFGVTEGSVYLNSASVTVQSWSDTEIVVQTGAVDSGTDLLQIMAGDGYAVDGAGSIPQITVDLKITNVYPLQGSLVGGTKLTVTGSGFGTNDTQVEVMVGDISCDIDTVTNTEIMCMVGKAGKVHQVSNKGTDPAFGVYYAFDKPFITVNKGDFVHWSWETPVFVNNIAHSIIEIDSPSATTPKVGGFSSTASKNGQYQYQFTETGEYYVWSGYVDEWGIKNYVGTIEVVEPVSVLAEISVTLAGKAALHDVGGASDPVDSSACNAITSAKSGCSDALPSGGNPDKFNFAFWTCSTPSITSIDRNNGTETTTLTISGEGLSTSDCQNEILFSEQFACDVTSSSSSDVTCTMSTSGEPELGVLHPVSVRVGNRGYALINIMELADHSFGLVPSVSDIQPTAGSMAGGAAIVLSGFGFGDTPFVYIGGYPCTILTSTYTQITCETPSSTTQSAKDITVHAYVNGNPFPAECEAQTCQYSYSYVWTPTVTSISPSSMNGSTTFTITGTELGDVPSDLDVTIGGVSATVTAANVTFIEATVQNIPAGSNNVVVKYQDFGNADGTLTVTGSPSISSVNPSTGSNHGNTYITIAGHGFVEGDTTITLDSTACVIESIALDEVVCVTASHAAGAINIDVTSNSISYPSATFTYDSSSTPTISSISPTAALAASTLTISGSNLAGGAVTVLLDDVPCVVTTSSATEIQCTIGDHATGSVPVSVNVADLGASNTDIMFEYQLSLSSISPIQGGTAGGQTLTLTGTGFDPTATATICGLDCIYKNSSTTEYMCKTPVNTAQTCDVAITVNGLTKTLSSAYTYDAALTPSLTGVTPTRGGTGGGTTLTVTGSGFGNTPNDVMVTIDDTVCVVATVADTVLTCVTGSHLGSIETKVEVEVSGNGIAEEAVSGDGDFHYIDVWSSVYTWGGESLPQEGEFIIVPAGMTLLLDTDTPRLDFLLIQGGKLIFDEQDIELNSNIIMITDGGLLQIGTESEPFQHKAIITLHGHHRSKELPIYGTKVLAVRNGTLDLHGIETSTTWTRLASTSAAGSNTLQLETPVDWNVGDEVVIAATGHHHTQNENEKKTITAKSGDNMTLTLDSALEAEHVGTEETFDGTLVEFRGEVGLLTHNVVVRGNTDPQWEEEITACAAGFNTGEFATQTCFLGRFGDEIGSSQFGAMILVHSPVKDTHEAQARISYTEVTFAGQAFRLGRYPIHFHLNGDMSTSYVRGCGIHHTFNRAVNIHGTHNTMVEKNVIYNIMGGAFFLEDGIETGNTLQYNLAVFVRESSSLLNDDITPASFWITNPDNIVQHNAAAGGTHFGFWYRMHGHPDGPSFTSDVCPQNVPLGVFANNTAHSFGWFGLWIFENYFPLQGGCGGSQVEPAVFQSLFAWNNDKGAEAVNSGAIQFEDFVLVQNKKAGYEGKKVLNVPQFTDESPMLKDSLIVGKTTVIPSGIQGCTSGGVVFPYGSGFRLKNIRFVNFADSCSSMIWTRITGTCSINCGGYSYHTEGLSFINAPNKANYAWEWEGIIIDKDGTATGNAGWSILPTSGTLPTNCESAPAFSIGIAASMCPPEHKWHRYAFNNPKPASLEGKDFMFSNEYGASQVEFMKKRLSHKPGWMCALLDGATYLFGFENALHIKNISFTGQFYDFDSSDYLILRLPVDEYPDRFTIDGGKTFINNTVTLDPSTNGNGDWEWDNVNTEIKFLVHGTARSRRGMSTYAVDKPWGFSSFKCFFKNCIPPPDPNTVPPELERPSQFEYWNDTTRWNLTDGYLTNIGGGSGIPQDFDNVKIALYSWMIVNNTNPNKFGVLLLEGVLEFIDSPGAVYTIEADHIIIMGGRLIIGWPEDPFDGLASITLRGNHSSPYFDVGDGPTVGAKAIAVFGGLDLFGKEVGIAWTLIASTVNAGDNQIVLSEPVTWSAGDDIVIGPTSFNPWETESFKITSVASDNMTLTLNDTLRYKHIAHTEVLSNGLEIPMGAAVGLLTRNIKIIGQDYDDLYVESFGARVLVGLTVYNKQTYAGYARLSNVEFYHTGQEGFTEPYDPRMSVAYVATGTVSHIKPSTVTKCSFHNGFNTAVGAFGIGSLNITDNVVYGTVGDGLRTSSDDTALVNNMVALMISTASYQDRFETFNPRWEAGIEAMEAKRLILQDNLVTGSERIAYHVPTQECDDTSDNYSNNRAFANVIGVVVLPTDSLQQASCAKLSSFTSWKTHDFGMYYQNAQEFVSENNIFVENQNGLLPIVLGPGALGHGYAEKRVEVRNCTFVGHTATFDCANDVSPSNDDNFGLSGFSRPGMAPSGGMIGLIFPQFFSGSNTAPNKPWKGIMSYNAIGGLMKLSDTTFVNYGAGTCQGDYAVTTNPGNDDGQHPIESGNITLINVENDYLIAYHRPNVGKVNSADCVDMDCDALKKALFKDLDGTFLGHVGSVIPQSEYEWGGDPRRGLGDYRIPKEMVTTLDGTRIPYADMMPNKGIIRNDNCTYRSTWQAYECREDLNYEMLIIESMDSDTETRRLSPVAILGDGYIDLINGPQDHGWCSGYTCRKRVSTFMSLVATDHEYLMHFTSTTPKSMRYRLINSQADEVIKLTVWYSRSNRLDVFVDGTYVIATNARIDDNGRYILTMPQGDEFLPQITNDTGTNYFDRDRTELSIIIKGPQVIDVRSSETIIVSFGLPALSVNEFFGENLVENLAAFLNIPLTKIRIVNIVSASGSGRKKRSASGLNVELEIGDEPSTSYNDSVSDSIDFTSLLDLASEVVNECQAGNVSSTLNISGGCNSVTVPASDPDVASIVYSTPTPVELVFTTAPVAKYEGVLLETQPKVQAIDINGVVLTLLGTSEHPWQLTASIRPGTGNPNAVFEGTLTVNASDGWFNFTDLAISHMGTGYIIDFNVTFPTIAENFTIESSSMDVPGRPIKVNVLSVTSGDIVRYSRFDATLDLRDENTNDVITDITWRDHTWSADVALLGNSDYASLTGVTTVTFDTTTGQAVFPDLNITGFGSFYLQFHVVSSPPDFNLTKNHKIQIAHPNHIGMTIEETYEVKVKFDADFNKILSTTDKQNEFEQMMLTEYANLWPDVQLSLGSVYEGSIVVTFVISGTMVDVNTTAYSMCDSIYNGTVYQYSGYSLTLSPYLTINNETYYGVTCGDLSGDDDSDSGLEPWMIALIVIASVLLLIAIVALVVWRLKMKSKTKTHNNLQGATPGYLGNDNKAAGDIIFREDTFTSMKFSMGGASPMPPNNTNLGSLPEKRPLSSNSVHPSSTPAIVTKLVKKDPPVRVPSPSYLDTPTPSYLDPMGSAVYVDPPGEDSDSNSHPLSPSPAPSRGSSSPMLLRSPSPLPDSLYHGSYINKPIEDSLNPYLAVRWPSDQPKPSDQSKKPKNPKPFQF